MLCRPCRRDLAQPSSHAERAASPALSPSLAPARMPTPLDAIVCHGGPHRALRVMSNQNAGWGNRLGWWLTAATIGDVLNKTVYTFWRQTSFAGHCCDYDVSLIMRVVQFPASLQIIGARAYDKMVANATDIPEHPRPYINDYTPEPAIRPGRARRTSSNGIGATRRSSPCVAHPRARASRTDGARVSRVSFTSKG